MVACFTPVDPSKILFKLLYTHTVILLAQKVKFLLREVFSQFVTYCKTTEHLKFKQTKNQL